MATLEQVFQREKAWIAACDDVDALVEKIGDYREDVRVAERDGHMLMRMRAGDLIELAQSRVVGLQAREIRAARPTPVSALVGAPAPLPAQAERAKPPVAQVAKADPDAQRAPAPAETVASATAKAKADARLAAAAAERVELQNALLRAQVEATRRAASAAPPNEARVPRVDRQPQPPTTAASTPSGGAVPRTTAKQAATVAQAKPAEDRRASSTNRAPAPKPAATKEALPDGYCEADRLALASVGRWPPMPADRRSAFWTRDADWPSEWTLTGGDLGRFRGDLNLTRAIFAAQLGVPSDVIKEAELRPREKVGPALQIALRKAMEFVGEQRRREREERQVRAEAAARPAASVELLEGVGANSPAAVDAPLRSVAVLGPTSVERQFTGADLARLRAARGLTQKEIATLLRVEQGTISKGEAKGGRALGPGLQRAMASLTAWVPTPQEYSRHRTE